MPQSVTYTPENIARLVDGMFSINSTGHPVAHMSVPEHFVFTSRVQLAISSVCARLNATLPARAIADDMDGVAEPVTELGKLHHAWAVTADCLQPWTIMTTRDSTADYRHRPPLGA
jgi:hypothetical protein